MTEPRSSVANSAALPGVPAGVRASRSSSRTRVTTEYLLPLLLLAASVVTTTAIGARFMQNFLLGHPAVTADADLWPWPWLFQDPHRFALGWPFSISLLAILLTHEFGHYFACRAHGIRATLPWVLPAPTLSGTAGAVIQIRSRIPNRRALVDVGVYGPLAGYAASLIAVILGLALSHPAPPDQPPVLFQFGQPISLELLPRLLHLPAFATSVRHPILIAGWVGLFVTALNLIPGGQLDGGHLLYALSPRIHRWTTRCLPAILFILGLFFWIGWALWGAMLLIPAMRRHPTVPKIGPLGPARRILCLLALAVFALTFAAEPFVGNSLLNYLHWLRL